MKVISNEYSKVVRLHDPDEVKQNGEHHIADIIQKISDKYRFVISPTTSDAMKSSLEFQNGQLINNKRRYLIGFLGIYNDGVVVNSLDTEHSELILNEICDWYWKEFNFTNTITKVQKLYENQAVVEFDKRLKPFLDLLASFYKSYEKKIKKTYSITTSINLSRFTCGADPASLKTPFKKLPDFTIERRLNSPHSENRFISSAPLSTKDHISLLKEFEKHLLSEK